MNFGTASPSRGSGAVLRGSLLCGAAILAASVLLGACSTMDTIRGHNGETEKGELARLQVQAAGVSPVAQRPILMGKAGLPERAKRQKKTWPLSAGGGVSLVPHIPLFSKGVSMISTLVRDPILRPVSSAKRLVFLSRHVVDELVVPSPLPTRAAGELPPLASGPGMDLAEFEGFLDRETGGRASYGKVEFLIDGEAYFNALNQAVGSAESSIKVRTYIFDNDDVAVRFADLLKERSGDAKVKVLYDRLGSLVAGGTDSETLPASFKKPKSIKRYLKRNSKVRVRRNANPWLTSDHTKTIIIDRKTAFLGGMNIGREYRYDWHDLMVEVTGPVVGELDRDFAKAWRRAGPMGDLGSVFGKKIKSTPGARPEGARLRILRTKPGSAEIYRATMEAIRRAKSYIYIENAYMTDNRLLRALAAARQRGVDVRVILPAKNDSPILKASNVVTANALHQAGVRVYLYPGMSHVKAMAVDGWAIFGSANMDWLSLKLNRELNLASSDKDTVDALLERLFEADFEVSMEMTEPMPAGPLKRLAELLANQL